MGYSFLSLISCNFYSSIFACISSCKIIETLLALNSHLFSLPWTLVTSLFVNNAALPDTSLVGTSNTYIQSQAASAYLHCQLSSGIFFFVCVCFINVDHWIKTQEWSMHSFLKEFPFWGWKQLLWIIIDSSGYEKSA